mmetsp:Transcript_10469/g.25683  ORF Transcript_10469/g.25683 Transcript_10469/m.25683 type:complete len:236 (-) Transcript_10469:810-1517(-)
MRLRKDLESDYGYTQLSYLLCSKPSSAITRRDYYTNQQPTERCEPRRHKQRTARPIAPHPPRGAGVYCHGNTYHTRTLSHRHPAPRRAPPRPADCPKIWSRSTRLFVGEGDALVDGRLELRDELCEPLLLVFGDVTHGEHLFGAAGSELHLGGKEGELGDGGGDVGALVHVGFAREAAQASLSHACGGIRHRESGRPGARLGLHHLGPRVLDANRQRLHLLRGELDGRVGLRQQG